MNRRIALVFLLVIFGLLFIQCSSGGDRPVPAKPVRTIEDVDRDLQAFKTAIRSEISSRSNLYLVIGGISVGLNLILFGFVLYFRGQIARLIAAQKKPVRKKAAPKKAVKKTAPKKTEPKETETGGDAEA